MSSVWLGSLRRRLAATPAGRPVIRTSTLPRPVLEQFGYTPEPAASTPELPALLPGSAPSALQASTPHTPTNTAIQLRSGMHSSESRVSLQRVSAVGLCPSAHGWAPLGRRQLG